MWSLGPWVLMLVFRCGQTLPESWEESWVLILAFQLGYTLPELCSLTSLPARLNKYCQDWGRAYRSYEQDIFAVTGTLQTPYRKTPIDFCWAFSFSTSKLLLWLSVCMMYVHMCVHICKVRGQHYEVKSLSLSNSVLDSYHQACTVNAFTWWAILQIPVYPFNCKYNYYSGECSFVTFFENISGDFLTISS